MARIKYYDEATQTWKYADKAGGGGTGGGVNSVNGQTGDVVLDAEDVGALPDDTPLFSGNYNDLSNKPTIPVVPSNVSAFTNDAGYLTEHQSLSAYRTSSEQDDIDSGKLAVNQGVAHAGKFMVVGADGNIAPTAMTEWSGGSY